MFPVSQSSPRNNFTFGPYNRRDNLSLSMGAVSPLPADVALAGRHVKSSEDFAEELPINASLVHGSDVSQSEQTGINKKPVKISRDLKNAIKQLQSVPMLPYQPELSFDDDDFIETPPSSYRGNSLVLESISEVTSPHSIDINIDVVNNGHGRSISPGDGARLEVKHLQNDHTRCSTGSDTVFYDSSFLSSGSSRYESNHSQRSTEELTYNQTNFNNDLETDPTVNTSPKRSEERV